MIYTFGKTRLTVIMFLLCGALLESVHAQTLYVADTLRVGIRPEPINGGPSIAVVSSGTPLEIIENKGRHTKVRSPGGTEGWVKSAYLSKSKPAQLLLEEALAHTKRLENEITRIRSGSPAVGGEKDSDIVQLENDKQQLQLEVERLQQQVGQGISEFGGQSLFDISQSNMAPLYFIIGGLIFILSLGFLFGVTWHKHQVTKRLGGLSL
ncbi:MAG: TIGR04211 family SH3 domain-containing protein [Gammaproteobacteria bacterium]|nr:TIGR04211 family SH3 domain-containing protein [Gammaproteobacteria bacterium]